MAKERPPFEYDKPNDNTYLTQAACIGWENKPLPTAINEKNDAKSTTGNANASSIEGKVNALIDCVTTLIDKVVFHSGTPFVTSDELKSQLNLLRYTYSGSGTTTPAICGQAICGQTICGTV